MIPPPGANPHLADRWGHTPLARLEENMGLHDDPQLAARYAEAHRLVKAAVEASAPLSRAAKREGGCGGCGRADVRLDVCSRCKLRPYCSRECQVKDWPLHKQRCVRGQGRASSGGLAGDRQPGRRRLGAHAGAMLGSNPALRDAHPMMVASLLRTRPEQQVQGGGRAVRPAGSAG